MMAPPRWCAHVTVALRCQKSLVLLGAARHRGPALRPLHHLRQAVARIGTSLDKHRASRLGVAQWGLTWARPCSPPTERTVFPPTHTPIHTWRQQAMPASSTNAAVMNARSCSQGRWGGGGTAARAQCSATSPTKLRHASAACSGAEVKVCGGGGLARSCGAGAWLVCCRLATHTRCVLPHGQRGSSASAGTPASRPCAHSLS